MPDTENTCGQCKHFWHAETNEECCRRNPPQGMMQITPAKLHGAPPQVNKLSFYPPVNVNMSCGEFEQKLDS